MHTKPNRILPWPRLGRTRRRSKTPWPTETTPVARKPTVLNVPQEQAPREQFQHRPVHILKHRSSPDSFRIQGTATELFSQSRKRKITLNIQDQVHSIDSLLLRDACPCTLCVDSSTTQKLFSTTDIPEDIRARPRQVNADGSFSVSWSSDTPGLEDHISEYPPGFLSTKTNRRTVLGRVQNRFPRVQWSRDSLKENQITIDYDQYLCDTSALHAVTRNLVQYGLAFISGVPPVPESVDRVTSRIGPLMHTIYGRTWDVRSVDSPKNVADRDSDLNFHMDLLYYSQPPRLQALHCLKQSQEGGESLFTDGFRAVSELAQKRLQPAEPSAAVDWRHPVTVLADDEIPYHYKNDGQWLEHSHPTLVLSHLKRPDGRLETSRVLLNPELLQDAFQAVRWSPPFQAPLSAEDWGYAQLDSWLTGAKMLKAEFEQEEAIFQTKLSEGTCVIFDNWRVLHARKGFSGGERWLRGAYVGDPEFQQAMLKLAHGTPSS